MKKNVMLALAVTASLGAGAAMASPDFGSAIFSTYRSCAGLTVCDGNGLGQQVEFPPPSEFGGPPNGPSILSGGDMVSSMGSFNQSDGSASSSVTFETANSEPVMSGTLSSAALGDDRTGSNGVGFYTYTNTGGVAVDVVLSASIAFNSSSVSPTGTDGASLAGGAEYEASVAIVDPSYLADQMSGPDSLAYGAGYTAADTYAYDLMLGVPSATCGEAGVYALGTVVAATTGGSGATSVSSSACAGGGAYIVDPGQTVIVVDWYHLDANRGGYIDPFTMSYTEAPTNVPEPATWSLMLGGVGLIGGALRRRARAEKLAA